MVPEVQLEETGHGLAAAGPGWFVLNACDAPWILREGRGAYCALEGFEGKADFPHLGVNLTVLGPGEPMSMYHTEDEQEAFLVLSGEALLIVEGEERPLRRWDFFHCPPGTGHTIVGADDGPCAILAVGSRRPGTEATWHYPVDETAVRHGAGVTEATGDWRRAYAHLPGRTRTRYRDGLLPGPPTS